MTSVSVSEGELLRFRQRRAEVELRHASIFAGLGDLSRHHVEGEVGKIRSHCRWPELMGREEASEIEERDEQRSSVLGPGYYPAECTIRNDYSQHYVDSGLQDLPGNAVRNPSIATRFQEYPKLRRLIGAKAALLDQSSIPPTYLRADLLHSLQPFPLRRSDGEAALPFHLLDLLPHKFDVILIDPPLEAYEWESCPSNGEEAMRVWSWDQVAALPIPQLMAKESFAFLWIGSGAGDGLERGREVLMRWGYRRCEDIVWIRTNDDGGNQQMSPTCSTFTQTVQHCLMGIRGTVTRSRDARFVHCNVDTDVILWPGERASGATEHGQHRACHVDVRCKPPEMMDLIENFCLGTRRIELFGCNRNIRRGWLTIGSDVGPDLPNWKKALEGENACAASAGTAPMEYNKSAFDSFFTIDRPSCSLHERTNLVPYSEEIDHLRPRTPPHNEPHVRTRNSQRSLPSAGRWSKGNDGSASQIGTTTPSLRAHAHASGAGLSGLGAGGNAVVSVPSGSELLSGAQANVIFGGQQGAGTANGAIANVHVGPSGLGRKARRAG